MKKIKAMLDSILEKIESKKGKTAIITHTNPDPDAIAAAFGLVHFFDSAGIKAEIYYDGIIGRINNRIMVELLEIPIKQVTKSTLSKYEFFCLVDTQPGKRNNCFPPDKRALMVIDHHFEEKKDINADFVDIRKNIGSTAAMVCQYLDAYKIEIPSNLATALFYGIKTDTDGLLRDYSKIDEKYYRKLFSKVDYKALHAIEYPELPKDYFYDFADALNSARIYNDILIADLGQSFVPDMTGEMADYLLRMEGINLVLVFGEFENRLYFSLRTVKKGKKLGMVSFELTEGIGSGGGHNKTGGGVVENPLLNKKVFLDRFFVKFGINPEKLSLFYSKI